jgi:hypothetical protein
MSTLPALGKGLKPGGMSGAAGGAGALVGGIVDSFNKPDKFGKVKTGMSVASGAVKGAGAGMQYGPIGAIVGGAVGMIGGFLGARKANREAANTKSDFYRNEAVELATASAQSYANNSQFGNEGVNWMKDGGPLNVKRRKIKAINGNLKPIGEFDYSIKGRSHEKGGIFLPGHDAEVEDKESATELEIPGVTDGQGGLYIFSDNLKDPFTGKSYSSMHEGLAARAAKAESHGGPEAMMTASVMRKRIEKLAHKQELHRQFKEQRYEQSLLNA